jgi:alkylhydroperoxidase family enzyme
LRYGVSPADIIAIADESEGLPTTLEPLARAVLAATRQLTRGFDVDDDLFATLQRELGNEQLLELLFAVTTYTATVRLLTTLRVEVEDDYLGYLATYPIRASR